MYVLIDLIEFYYSKNEHSFYSIMTRSCALKSDWIHFFFSSETMFSSHKFIQILSNSSKRTGPI